MGAAVEWLTAHVERGLAGDAELKQDLAVERDLADKMAAVIGQEHRVVRRHMNAMRARILAFTPGAQKIAGAIEDHHRVFAAVEHVDVVVAVDANPADLLERPAVGQLRPVGVDLVSKPPASDDHPYSPLVHNRHPRESDA